MTLGWYGEPKSNWNNKSPNNNEIHLKKEQHVSDICVFLLILFYFLQKRLIRVLSTHNIKRPTAELHHNKVKWQSTFCQGNE